MNEVQNNDPQMPYTSIKIQMETRDDLKELGKMGDTWDTVIKRLIQFYREHQDLKK